MLNLQKHSKKLYILLLAIIVVSSVIFAVWYFRSRMTYDQYGFPSGLISYKFLSSRPEATLYYPNSKVFSLFGRDQKVTEEGLGVAFAGAILTSSDSPEAIYQWYDNWLLAHGWHENKMEEGAKVDTQLSVREYDRGQREFFEVAMDDPESLSGTLGKQVPTSTTVFESSYMIK